LKVDLIRQHAKLPCLTKYVRKNRSGKFHGVIGALFSWSEGSEKRFSKVLQSLCIYSSVTSEVETESQLKKFLDAVTCEEPVGLSLETLGRISSSTIASVGHHTIDPCENSLVFYRGSSEKFAPIPHSDKTVPQDREVLRDYDWIRSNDNFAFCLKHSRLYAPVFKSIGVATHNHNIERLDPYSYAGEVHFIQEPGYKLRAVASPYRIHQLALKPFGNTLGRIVKMLPWDCTFDQAKAFPIIQKKIKSGCTIYSIDLSNATDYFPLSVQMVVLRSIFGDIPELSLFQDISRMRWKSAHGDVIWKRGQPLGMYPSFFAFTLTHGMVLNSLARGPGEFLVVGDDVVIFDEELNTAYIQFLDACKCPYSTEKSLISSVSAEFAGKVITANSVIPQLKWRKMSNDSFLDLAKLLGPRSRELMTKRQQVVFDSVRSLQEPIGLNMSTPGNNMLSSWVRTQKILDGMQQRSVRSLTELIRTTVRNASDDPSKRILNPDTSTFDKKVCMVFQQTVFKHYQWLEHVADLPQALGLEPRLPIEACPTRVSTLVRYERMLSTLVE